VGVGRMSPRSGHQAITHTPDRLDLVATQLLPQVSDIDVHDVAPGIEVVSPDVGEKLTMQLSPQRTGARVVWLIERNLWQTSP
jgi:hypothetical protein